MLFAPASPFQSAIKTSQVLFDASGNVRVIGAPAVWFTRTVAALLLTVAGPEAVMTWSGPGKAASDDRRLSMVILRVVVPSIAKTSPVTGDVTSGRSLMRLFAIPMPQRIKRNQARLLAAYCCDQLPLSHRCSWT